MKKRGLIIGVIAMACAMLIMPTGVSAKTKTPTDEKAVTNVYVFGDSIMDGYLNNNQGIKYYMNLNIDARQNNIKVVSDYSKQGSIICSDMPEQVDGIVKDLRKHKGERNVVIFDGGTNDIVKGCRDDHMKNLKKLLKQIHRVDRDVEFIVVIPDHIKDFYATNQALSDTYTSLELLKDCRVYKTSRKISGYNLQSDYMHIKAAGYRLIVADLVRMVKEY